MCTKRNRSLLVLLARATRSWRQALLIVQPETLLRWHRQGFRLFWKHKSKATSQKPKVAGETILPETSVRATDGPDRGRAYGHTRRSHSIPSLIETASRSSNTSQARAREAVVVAPGRPRDPRRDLPQVRLARLTAFHRMHQHLIGYETTVINNCVCGSIPSS